MKPLDAWTDFLSWWADQVEKAKNLQDKEAMDARAAAAKVGEKQVEATNAMLADRDAIAKASGCASPINCNSQEMKDFRASVENIKGLSPAEQLEFYQRVAYNVYKFDVEPSNGCSNCKAGLSAVLHNLALSTAQGKKNGAKTAEDMWGNSRGFSLNHNQREQMSRVQKSILFGKASAAAWSKYFRATDRTDKNFESFATWFLGDLSDDEWYKIAEVLFTSSAIVLLTAGLGYLIIPLLSSLISAGLSTSMFGILTGMSTLLQQFGANYAINITILGIANIACGKSFTDGFSGNNKAAAITAFGASFVGALPKVVAAIKVGTKAALFNSVVNIAKSPIIDAVPSASAATLDTLANISQNCW